MLKIKTGPLGLKGFTTTEGRLCTYDVKPPETSSIRNEDYILQLEAYSEEKRNVRIVMYTAENTVTKYTSVLHLEKARSGSVSTLKFPISKPPTGNTERLATCKNYENQGRRKRFVQQHSVDLMEDNIAKTT